VFDIISQEDIATWNAMIPGCYPSKLHQHFEGFFQQYVENIPVVTQHFFPEVISSRGKRCKKFIVVANQPGSLTKITHVNRKIG
jgi:phosphoribosylpyrophosphate synthetase